MADNPSLVALIGQDIWVRFLHYKSTHFTQVKLVGVEAGGIWFESGEFMDYFWEGTNVKMTEKSFQIFVPYAQILGIYHMGGGPWISEKVAR